MELHSSGLLSKWGFGDGDQVEGYAYSHLPEFADSVGIGVDDRLVLIDLVETHLIPALDQEVTWYWFSTNHNPVRVGSINGVDFWDHYTHELDHEGMLTPVSVTVTDDQIRESIRRVEEKYGKRDVWDVYESRKGGEG